MHGLTTIGQLNELAAQNAPGAPEAAIAKAEESRAGRPTRFELDVQADAQRRRDANEAKLLELSAFDTLELVGLVQLAKTSTLLEIALANRLAYVHSLLAESSDQR